MGFVASNISQGMIISFALAAPTTTAKSNKPYTLLLLLLLYHPLPPSHHYCDGRVPGIHET